MCILTDQFLFLTVEQNWDKDYTQKWCRSVISIQTRFLDNGHKAMILNHCATSQINKETTESRLQF